MKYNEQTPSVPSVTESKQKSPAVFLAKVSANFMEPFRLPCCSYLKHDEKMSSMSNQYVKEFVVKVGL